MAPIKAIPEKGPELSYCHVRNTVSRKHVDFFFTIELPSHIQNITRSRKIWPIPRKQYLTEYFSKEILTSDLKDAEKAFDKTQYFLIRRKTKTLNKLRLGKHSDITQNAYENPK